MKLPAWPDGQVLQLHCMILHVSGRFKSTSPTSFGNSDLEVEIKLQST